MNTSSKLKKGGAMALAMGFVQRASAFIWLVIVVLIVIVVAIMIYKIVQTIKRQFPSPPPQSSEYNITRIWEDRVDENGQYLSSGWIYDDSDKPTSAAKVEGEVTPSSIEEDPGFSFQYGVKKGGIGWTASGQSLDTGLFYDIEVTDQDNYAYTMASSGVVCRVTCVDGITTAELLEDDGLSVYHVVVERTTDMVNWTPIFTNAACGSYTVENFTDTNPPVNGAFYRTAAYQVVEETVP